MTYKQEQQELYQAKTERLIKGLPSYFEEYIMSLKSAKTRYNNILTILHWLKWMAEQEYIKSYEITEIETIKAHHIIMYLDTLTYDLQMDSILRKKSAISSFLGFLFLQEYISGNVEKRIPKQRFKEEKTNKSTEVQIPSEKDIKDLFDNIRYIPNDTLRLRWNAVVNIFLGSGIRADELIGLDLDDIHLDAKQPYIEVLGKGRQNKKDEVRISKNRVKAVQDYLMWRQNNKLNTNALFVSGYGKRLSKNTLGDFFRKYGNITPHMLRHWCASEMYKKCGDIEMVKRQLRHSDIRITIDHYVKGDDKKFLTVLNSL